MNNEYKEIGLYCFREKKSGRFVRGTDRRNGHRQMFDEYRVPTIVIGCLVNSEIVSRGINLKYYDVVEVDVVAKETQV
jgi:hypothetical protein